MASDKEYQQLIAKRLSGLEEVGFRAMMGEYVLYYRGKIIGDLYDNRLLVKPTAAAVSYLPDAARVSPYPGAKEMLLVEQIDDEKFLASLLRAMYDELPAPKKRTKRCPRVKKTG